MYALYIDICIFKIIFTYMCLYMYIYVYIRVSVDLQMMYVPHLPPRPASTFEAIAVRPGVCVERARSSVLKSPIGLRLGSSVLSRVGNASESLLTPWFSYNVGETMP